MEQEPLTLDKINTAIDKLTEKIEASNDIQKKEKLIEKRAQLINNRTTFLKITTVIPFLTESAYTGKDQKSKMEKLKEKLKEYRTKIVISIVSTLMALGVIGVAIEKKDDFRSFIDRIKFEEPFKPEDKTTPSYADPVSSLIDRSLQESVMRSINSALDPILRKEIDTDIKNNLDKNVDYNSVADILKNYTYEIGNYSTVDDGIDYKLGEKPNYSVWFHLQEEYGIELPNVNSIRIFPSKDAEDLIAIQQDLEFIMSRNYNEDYGYSDKGIYEASLDEASSMANIINRLVNWTKQHNITLSFDGYDANTILDLCKKINEMDKGTERD